jgi:thiamine pyrophosphate-dependent acetolactate synthase large subunit-like protein
MHPEILSLLASERHRDMLADAEQQRLARQLVSFRRASRRADRAERHMRRAVRKALQLRAALEP